MMIIGCDFHPSWQQVSWLDSETGKTGEQKRVRDGVRCDRLPMRLVERLLKRRSSWLVSDRKAAILAARRVTKWKLWSTTHGKWV